MASGDKFYIADKVTLDEVKGKIGNTSDTGGSSAAGSVFGKLNYLVAQVSTYLSNIHTYVSRIGATNDAQSSSTSTGSVFAKINYLVSQTSSYLSGIYGFTAKIGNTADTGGTVTEGTISGKLNNILELTYKPVMKFEPAILTTTDSPSIVHQVRFATSEKLYCSTDDKRIFIYNVRNMKKIGEIPAQTGGCSGMYVTDGKIYYCEYTTNKVLVFDDNTYLKLGETAAQTNSITEICVADGRLFCNVLISKIAVFDANTFALLGNIAVTPLYGITIYDNILYVCTSSGVKLYNATTRAYIAVIESGMPREHVAVDSGTIFFTKNSTDAKQVYMYDVVTRLKIGEIEIPTDYCQYLFAEKGIVYVVTSDGHVYRINAITKTIIDDYFSINTGTVWAFVKDKTLYRSDHSTSGDYKAIRLKTSYQISYYEERD